MLRTAGARVVDGQLAVPRAHVRLDEDGACSTTSSASGRRCWSTRCWPRSGRLDRRSLGPVFAAIPQLGDRRPTSLRPGHGSPASTRRRRSTRHRDDRAPARGRDRVGCASSTWQRLGHVARLVAISSGRTGSGVHRCPAFAARGRQAANNRGRSRDVRSVEADVHTYTEPDRFDAVAHRQFLFHLRTRPPPSSPRRSTRAQRVSSLDRLRHRCARSSLSSARPDGARLRPRVLSAAAPIRDRTHLARFRPTPG